MALADEAGKARSQLGAALKAGVDTIASNQTIIFTQYVRKVLPLDGFVFWVRADIVSPPVTPLTQTVMGSLHYATEKRQDEQETFAVNRVVFTSESPIDFLNEASPTRIWVASFDQIRFSFGGRKNLYRPQARLWHYFGDAVYPDVVPQLVDTTDQLNALGLIVSNSLPLWLAMNEFSPNWPFYPATLPATIFPSFLSPLNLVPPFITAHIGEGDTAPLVSAQTFSPTNAQSLIAVDTVRLTLWGLNNQQAMTVISFIAQYSYDTGFFGVMNSPVVHDAKREQRELAVLAQKKVIDFTISYLQGTTADTARQLITQAGLTFYPQGT